VDEHRGRHSETFDTRDEAIFAQQKYELEVKEIKRGLRGSIQPNKTVGDICDYWLERRVPQKRSPKDDRSVIKMHIRELLGDVRLRDLNVGHTDLLKAKRSYLDPKTVHNILTLLISMLNVAVDLGWLARAPRIRKPRIPVFSKDFSYLRSKEEVTRFLRAARAEGELAFAFYAAAIYTGMRQGELAGLRWSDVDLDARRIVVQRSYDGPTKAGDVRYVPILDPMLPVLRAWRLMSPGDIVFPNQLGSMQGRCARLYQEIFHRVLDASGFEKVQRNGKTRRYIRFHDLRHTFASHWVVGGGDLFRLQKILGHKTVQMTMRYAHLAPDAFVGDYGRLGAADPVEAGRVIALPVAASGS
jgi:integrase